MKVRLCVYSEKASVGCVKWELVVLREEEDRDLQTTMPPTDLPSSAWHRWATVTCLPTCHVLWIEDVTQGLTNLQPSLQLELWVGFWAFWLLFLQLKSISSLQQCNYSPFFRWEYAGRQMSLVQADPYYRGQENWI